MFGIKYMDFYSPPNLEDAYKVLKDSNHWKTESEDYCKFFIQQNHLNKIFVENDNNEIEIIDILLNKVKEQNKELLEAVDYIFFCKNPYGFVYDDVQLPYYIAAKYCKKTTVLNMFQECSTSLQAFELSKAFILSDMARNTMIVTMSMLKGSTEDRFIETSILGDGAGILILGKDAGLYSIENTLSISNGCYSLNISKQQTYSPMETIKRCGGYLKDFINGNHLANDELLYVVPQNVSYSNTHLIAKYIEVELDKFYLDNLGSGGHLADVDTVRNLVSITSQGVESKKTILTYSIGNIRPGMDFVFNSAMLKKV